MLKRRDLSTEVPDCQKISHLAWCGVTSSSFRLNAASTPSTPLNLVFPPFKPFPNACSVSLCFHLVYSPCSEFPLDQYHHLNSQFSIVPFLFPMGQVSLTLLPPFLLHFKQVAFACEVDLLLTSVVLWRLPAMVQARYL